MRPKKKFFKEIKDKRWKEIQIFFSADDMIINIKIPKESTDKQAEITHEFSKISRYKINIQFNIYMLATNIWEIKF